MSDSFVEYLNKKYPLDALKGISTKRVQLLEELGVSNQVDLLYFFPRTYDDWGTRTPLSSIEETGIYTFEASVASKPYLSRKGKLSWLRFRLMDHGYFIDVTVFNQPWLRNIFQVGDVYVFQGKVEVRGNRLSIVNPAFLKVEEAESVGMVPNYALKKGLTQQVIRQGIQQVINSGLASKLSDALPDYIRKKFSLSTLAFAIQHIHHAKNDHDLRLARYRLAFDELFLMRSALGLANANSKLRKATALKSTKQVVEKMNDLRKNLPFNLTKSQVEAINDILRDLRETTPMNRLLQGDVGSGKTMVAIFAMAYVALCGGQAVMMAPTSILAEQHHSTAKEFLEKIGVKCELLLGGTKIADRRKILEACRSGTAQVVIGTHALLQADVEYKNLVLTITDEQHRFGVKQRSSLGGEGDGKKNTPHRLHMSATPIPRSLAMIFFSDFSMSIMQSRPSGRPEIITRIVREKDLPTVYQDMRIEIEQGGQAYVVCPLIEESESLEAKDAATTHGYLSQNVFPDYRVGLLHGRMKPEEKDRLMRAFIEREIDVLVSTTVVEVGVDNQNATVMLILNAERFGLAQLHQLRGRVGRGPRQSYCFVQSDQEEGNAEERLEALVLHSDGFVLAETDLRQRGPGDFLGTRQHGLPAFHLLNLYDDHHIIAQVDEAISDIENLKGDEAEDVRATVQKALHERYPDLESSL